MASTPPSIEQSPYARPPVGNLRFMPPKGTSSPIANDTVNATQFKARCIQVPGEFAWTEPYTSEDCLTLTVYAPPGNQSNLPVKVWAHGGADAGVSASYPLYDLCHMATDSIAVAVQYRLGPLGYLALEPAGIEGNMGVKDKILALELVQSNIAAFGGDPKKVLLFGQSAGADDSFAIASLPQAKSLMSSVICESGGGLDLPPKETIERVGADYARALKCSASDLACLQSRSPEQLMSVYETLPVLKQGQGSISNPANSYYWSLTDYPNGTDMSNAFQDGKLFMQQPLAVGPQVPIVLGSNTNDASRFTAPPFYEVGGPITVSNYTSFLTQFGPHVFAVAEKYPLSMFNSSGSTSTAVISALTHVQTVFSSKCFTYRGLRSAANSGVPAYAYSFGHALSCPILWFEGSPFPTTQEMAFVAQPVHTAEIPLVFGNLNSQPWGNGTCNMTDLEARLSATMKASWTAMAATGNPSIEGMEWMRFEECSTQGLYTGNTTVIQKLDFSECEFWDEIQEDLGGVSFSWPDTQACEDNGTNSTTVPYTSGQPGTIRGWMEIVIAGGLVALLMQQ